MCSDTLTVKREKSFRVMHNRPQKFERFVLQDVVEGSVQTPAQHRFAQRSPCAPRDIALQKQQDNVTFLSGALHRGEPKLVA